MTDNAKEILIEVIDDLKTELIAAEQNLEISEKVILAARQNIIRIKLKIAKLESLL